MVTEQLRLSAPTLRNNLTICPCCGFKFQGSRDDGCNSCGAQPVGDALPRPENELPSFGRSLLLAVAGSLMVLVFLTQTIIALVQKASTSIGFWSVVAAAETAAWRLKWIAIPATFLVLWAGRKIYQSVKESPVKFCGLRYARTGFAASVLVPALIALLIGVTVPARLRHRDERIQAQVNVWGLTIARAQNDYQLQYGTFPTDPAQLMRLPDPDGSIAAALSNVDSSAYKVTADLAALPTKKPRPLRGAVIVNADLSTPTDDSPQEGLSFTNYELRLAGVDKLMGTEDDVIVRDGLVMKASELTRGSGSANSPRLP